jgi:hypothetical protein
MISTSLRHHVRVSGSSRCLRIRELVEAGIAAMAGQQILMATLLDNATFAQNDNAAHVAASRLLTQLWVEKELSI